MGHDVVLKHTEVSGKTDNSIENNNMNTEARVSARIRADGTRESRTPDQKAVDEWKKVYVSIFGW